MHVCMCGGVEVWSACVCVCVEVCGVECTCVCGGVECTCVCVWVEVLSARVCGGVECSALRSLFIQHA